jgi:hypothetical protein
VEEVPWRRNFPLIPGNDVSFPRIIRKNSPPRDFLTYTLGNFPDF